MAHTPNRSLYPVKGAFILGLLLLWILISTGLQEIKQSWAANASELYGYNNVIGIHIGNTNSRVAILEEQWIRDQTQSVARILEIESGSTSIPSCVSFTEGGRLVGEAAKLRARSDPANTICNVWSLLGRSCADPEVLSLSATLPYQICGPEPSQDADRGIKIHIPGSSVRNSTGEQIYTPEDVASTIFHHLKALAENNLNTTTSYAVVAVPSDWNDAQRQAVIRSGSFARLNIIRLVREPFAAGIGHRVDTYGGEERTLVALDIGGTTTDATVMEVDQGVFEVLGTASRAIGGRNFTEQATKYLYQSFNEKLLLQGDEIGSFPDAQSMSMLEEEVDAAKVDLSTKTESRVELQHFLGNFTLNETLTRAKFEGLNEELFEQAIGTIHQALGNAHMNIDNVDTYIAIGGSSNIPKIDQLLSKLFDGEAWIFGGVTPQNAVVEGLAIQAEILSRDEDDGGCVLIVEDNRSSLGIESNDSIMRNIINRQAPIPTRKSQNVTTVDDYQSSMLLRIFEGERAIAEKNTLLGEIKLLNIRPALTGEVVVEQNHTLKVVAQEKGADNNSSLVLNNTAENRGISTDEMEQLIEDAEGWVKDIRLAKIADLKWYARELEHAAKKFTDEKHLKVASQNDISKILALIGETRSWLLRDAMNAPISRLVEEEKLLWTFSSMIDVKIKDRMFGVGPVMHSTQQIHDEL